jgi:hypothetical protein
MRVEESKDQEEYFENMQQIQYSLYMRYEKYAAKMGYRPPRKTVAEMKAEAEAAVKAAEEKEREESLKLAKEREDQAQGQGQGQERGEGQEQDAPDMAAPPKTAPNGLGGEASVNGTVRGSARGSARGSVK